MQLATGARLGEIVGLRREDIYLDAEIPYIPREARKVTEDLSQYTASPFD
jgi:integrase